MQVKLIKVGGRLVRHARRLVFQLAEVAMSRDLFQGVLRSTDGPRGDGRSLSGDRDLHVGPMRERVLGKKSIIMTKVDHKIIGAPTHHADIVNKGAVPEKKR